VHQLHIEFKKAYDSGWMEFLCNTGGEGGTYRVLVGKPEGKRPFGRLTCRWEDNIEMDLQEVGFGGMDWIDLAQNSERWGHL
jgi:hypothetical protein